MTRTTCYTMPSTKGEMAQTPAEQFARRVRELMHKKGWTQTELARRAIEQMPPGCNMDRQLISTYLAGKTLPRQVRLEALAKALEVEPESLVRSPLVEWRGGITPGNAARLPPEGAVQATVREGSTGLSLDVQGAQARLRVDQMVPLDIAIQIMGLLTVPTNS